MAGQPKKMAKKITELNAKMLEVWSLIEKYIPEQYERFELPLEETDELCQSWNRAVWAATDAMREMGALATMLRFKAGIPDPADFERYPEIAKMRWQEESAQAVPCFEQGTNGETEPIGPVDILD